MTHPTIAELRDLAATKGAAFEEVPTGSLPRNHVAFFRTAEGDAYILDSLSPSKRYQEQGGLVAIRWEGEDLA